MRKIDFAMIDELVEARKTLHGGKQGAPALLTDTNRIGAALNRSIILMLSATLQGYVEAVFFARAKRKLRLRGDDFESFQKLHSRWGNPSTQNIFAQFGKIGIIDPLKDLSWQGCRNSTVRSKIDLLNGIRNQLAHGANILKIDGRSYNLTLQKALNLRRFVEAFSDRFETHLRKS
jgi:hypothetical protein